MNVTVTYQFKPGSSLVAGSDLNRSQLENSTGDDQRVVGLAGARLGYAYEVSGIYGHLIALVVEEAYRGRGIGAALVREAEEWVKQRGGRTMALNSGTHRAEAHKFYERLGYVATGLRFVKKLQSGEDSM